MYMHIHFTITLNPPFKTIRYSDFAISLIDSGFLCYCSYLFFRRVSFRTLLKHQRNQKLETSYLLCFNSSEEGVKS